MSNAISRLAIIGMSLITGSITLLFGLFSGFTFGAIAGILFGVFIIVLGIVAAINYQIERGE